MALVAIAGIDRVTAVFEHPRTDLRSQHAFAGDDAHFGGDHGARLGAVLGHRVGCELQEQECEQNIF